MVLRLCHEDAMRPRRAGIQIGVVPSHSSLACRLREMLAISFFSYAWLNFENGLIEAVDDDDPRLFLVLLRYTNSVFLHPNGEGIPYLHFNSINVPHYANI